MTGPVIFRGWLVVAGSACGIAFGSAVFIAQAFPQLAASWSTGFGWSQAELAKAATLFLLLQVPASPLFGWLLDRWGSRRVACASIALFGIGLLALSRVGHSLTQLYAVFALIGLVSAGTNVISYSRPLSRWFDRRRGLALGLAAGAQAVGGALVPLLAAGTIAAFGWSDAVLGLAGIELLVCLPLVGLLVRVSPAPFGLRPDGDAPGEPPAPSAGLAPTGPSRAAILRSATFWKLGISFAAMGLTLYTVLIHQVFILKQVAGLRPLEAARLQAIAGIASLLGRIGFGMLLDRLPGVVVAVVLLACSALSNALYASSPGLVAVAAFLTGAALGGETDLMPYLASRYFGTQTLSSVFGWFLALFYIGAAIGPLAFAALAQGSHGVAMPLWALVALQLLPLALLLTLGRYPSPVQLAAAGRETPAGARA